MDYQFAIGFSDIFICDNSPSFALQTWSYHDTPDKKNKITMTHLPTTPGGKTSPQNLCYHQCYTASLKDGISWMAPFDVDEFLVLKKEHSNVVDFMEAVCQPPCGQISITWQMFGHSNRTRYVPVPVTRRFQHAIRTRNESDISTKMIKAIVDPKAIKSSMRWFHAFPLVPGRTSLDPEGNGQPRHAGWKRMVNFHPGNRTSIAVLHHYKFKSIEEWTQKMDPKERDFGKEDLEKYRLGWKDRTGDDFDDSAWKILKQRVPKYQAYDHVEDLGGGLV